MKIKNEKGYALLFTLVLMFFCITIGVGLVFITKQETKNTVIQKKGSIALYLADAGIEYVINRTKENAYTPGTYQFGSGEFVTSKTSLGSNTYEITSIGYIPNHTDTNAVKKKVVAIVKIDPDMPPYSVRAGSSITLSSNVTIKGNLRSNFKITIPSGVTIMESDSGKGDANIYTNSSRGSGILIDSNFTEETANCAFKSRGPANDPIDSDLSNTGIYRESNINHTGGYATLSIVENDDSSDTSYIPDSEFPFFCVGLLSEDTTFTSRYTVQGGTTLDLASKTWRFNDGITFDSNSCVKGNGAIWVPSGTGTSGIYVKSNVNFNSTSDINLIVTGSNWVRDIDLNSNFTLNGYMYGNSFVDINSNVTVNGMIDCKGQIDLSSNMTVTYHEIEFELPGTSGSIEILSWRQETP